VNAKNEQTYLANGEPRNPKAARFCERHSVDNLPHQVAFCPDVFGIGSLVRIGASMYATCDLISDVKILVLYFIAD
jgi:hypothetical protein